MAETTNIDVALLKSQMKDATMRLQNIEQNLDNFFRQDWNKLDVLISKQDALTKTVISHMAKDEAEHAQLRLALSALKTSLAVVAVLTSVALAAAGVKLVWGILSGG